MAGSVGYSGQAQPERKTDVKAVKKQAQAAREKIYADAAADLLSVQGSAPQGGSEDLAAKQ